MYDFLQKRSTNFLNSKNLDFQRLPNPCPIAIRADVFIARQRGRVCGAPLVKIASLSSPCVSLREIMQTKLHCRDGRRSRLHVCTRRQRARAREGGRASERLRSCTARFSLARSPASFRKPAKDNSAVVAKERMGGRRDGPFFS